MKKNRFLSVLLTLVILSAMLVIPANAATTLTKAHYPTGVVVNSGKLYWVAPTMSGLKETKLYKLTDGAWGTGTTVTSPAALDDETAVYKIECVYNGYSSEYVIQKNSGASTDGQMPYGYGWGTVKAFYMGVVADDRATDNHSLFIHSYAQGNNGRWIEFAADGSLIPNDLKTTGKKYQVDFDYKTTISYIGLWVNGLQDNISTTAGWHHCTKVIDWNDTRNSKTHELGFELAWSNDIYVDNLELYELDAAGNKTGNDLITFDGTFESSDNSATNGISNVKSAPGINSATLSWTKGENVLATRVYNPAGNLIAELGDATTLTIDGLTMGVSEDYKIASVYLGGYESAPVTVSVTPKWFDYTINALELRSGSSAAASLAAGDYTAYLSIKNNKSTSATAEVLAAVYTNNELKKVFGSGKTTIGTTPITADVKLTEDMFGDGKDTRVYLYVFDGIDTREVIAGGKEYK